MDATLAVSESGITQLMDDLLSTAHWSKAASGSWGPFNVGYSVYVQLSDGHLELIDTPIQVVRLHDLNLSGSLSASFSFDLGAILPEICIPPIKVCIPTPFGEWCTPQYCIPWPTVRVSVTPPFSVNFSVDFGMRVTERSTTWDIGLLVYPFSFVVDTTPMINTIITAIQKEVDRVLHEIPGIGDLIAHLIDLVINVLEGVIKLIVGAFDVLIHEVVLLDVFSPTIPVKLLSIAKKQVFLAASGPDDPEVDLLLNSLSAYIAQHELVAEAAFA